MQEELAAFCLYKKVYSNFRLVVNHNQTEILKIWYYMDTYSSNMELEVDIRDGERVLHPLVD